MTTTALPQIAPADVQRTLARHILADALAWVDCRVTGEYATADHVVLFGEVSEAAVLREGDSSVHLRRNGLSYWGI